MRRDALHTPATGQGPLITYGQLDSDVPAAENSLTKAQWGVIQVWDVDPAADEIADPDEEDVFTPASFTAPGTITITGDETEKLRRGIPVFLNHETSPNRGLYLIESATVNAGNTDVLLFGGLVDPDEPLGDLVFVRPKALKVVDGAFDLFAHRSENTLTEGTFVAIAPAGHRETFENALVWAGCGAGSFFTE